MFDPRIAFLISTPVFAATPNKETPWSKIFLLTCMFMKSCQSRSVLKNLEALRSETDWNLTHLWYGWGLTRFLSENLTRQLKPEVKYCITPEPSSSVKIFFSRTLPINSFCFITGNRTPFKIRSPSNHLLTAPFDSRPCPLLSCPVINSLKKIHFFNVQWISFDKLFEQWPLNSCKFLWFQHFLCVVINHFPAFFLEIFLSIHLSSFKNKKCIQSF